MNGQQLAVVIIGVGIPALYTFCCWRLTRRPGYQPKGNSNPPPIVNDMGSSVHTPPCSH
jgi:hypothetical protein